MTNKTNDMDTLIKLHNKGLIDDSAFTKAVKKLNEKAWPMTLPLDVRDSDEPFTQRNIDPHFGHHFDPVTGEKWVTKTSPHKATFTPTQYDDKIKGLSIPDLYSGSILKKEDIFENSVNAIYRKSEHPFTVSYDCVWCGESVNSGEYHDCKMGLKPKKSVELDVVVYSENRTLVPEHARSLLEKLDEVWAKRVDEYNNSKDDWERTVVKDEDGNEVVEWKAKLVTPKNLPTDVIVEGDDADINGLRHIFRLEIDECDC